MNIKVNIGKKTKWALIGLLMFVVGYILCRINGVEANLGNSIGLALLLISSVLEFGLFIAALAADFQWSSDSGIDHY